MEVSCGLEGQRLSLGVKARARRTGGCAGCADSAAHAAFEWRTRVPRQRGALLFLKATQTVGTTAPDRCSVQVGAATRTWADVEAGIVRSVDGGDVDVRVICTDNDGAFVGAAVKDDASCRDVEQAGAFTLDLEARPVAAPSIAATGPYHGPPGFERGMQTTRHCGNNPESWVRGSARLDTESGRLAVDIQLETDSTLAGPKGTVAVQVLDSDGKSLATFDSAEVGIGGKPPGKAVARTYSALAQLREYAAKRAVKLAIQVACTGSVTQLFGIGSDRVNQFTHTVR